MSSILIKKAIRAIWENKRAYIACIVLIAIGIMAYASLGIASAKLEISRDIYYKENNMADAFAVVKSIPKSAEETLLNIEGIENVSLRLKHDARAILPGNSKIITLRIVSVDTNAENQINAVSRVGNDFYSDNDILVSEGFLTSHKLKIGDPVTLIINGRETVFNICGTGSSPEYVYIIKDTKEVLPDAETFAIAFMPEQKMASMLDKTGIYNDIVFTLKTGYTFDDVKSPLEESLEKYGLISLVAAKDQMSYNMLKTEIESNKATTRTIPVVFVGMAIVVLYLMLKRVIEQDRMQIGTMKAFGYSNTEIVTHYLVYGLATGLTGAVLGAVGGYFLSGTFMEMYNEFYKLPKIEADVSLSFIVKGILIGGCGGIFGAFMGVRSILKLIPSEAMRPVAPKAVHKDSLRFFPFIKYLLTSGGNMAVRSMLRSKFRSFFIILGVMFSFGMLAFMGSYNTMIEDMLMNQFTKVQLYDVKVSFNSPVPYMSAAESMRNIRGVKTSEAFLEIPVEFSHMHRKSGIVITGISQGSSLYKIYDNKKKVNHTPTKTGVIISNGLSDNLEAKKGDTLLVSSPYLKEKNVTVLVADVVNQNLGSSCYMDITALAELFSLPDSATSVGVKADDPDYIKEYLKDGKNVGVIEDKVKTLENYRTMLGSYQYIMYVMEVMAIVIAFAIIYNTATISLSERKREFATLRVLGLHVKEVGEIMGFEYWVLCFLGILAGVPFTMFLKETLAASIDMEMFTFPTYTPLSAYGMAAAGCIVAVFFSNRSSVKKIKKFDMVEVLKERE